MSVVIRRFAGSRSAMGGHDKGLEAELQRQREVLRMTLDQGAGPGGEVYNKIAFLALVLANTALNNTGPIPAFQAIALQAVKITLSIISSLHNLIPDINDLTERDLKYVTALSADIGSIHQLFCEAHEAIIQILGPSATLVGLNIVQLERQLQRLHEAFLRKLSNFMTDPDLCTRRSDRERNKKADAHILDLDDVRIGSKYDVQPGPKPDFWDDTYRGVVEGKDVLIRTYPPAALKDFRRDLGIMKANRHSNLPALFGRSDEGSSTPFIVVSADTVLPLPDYISTLCRKNPEVALGEIWKMFINIRYTAEYLLNHDICDDGGDLLKTLEAAVVRESGQVMLAPSFPHAARGWGGNPELSMTLPEVPGEIGAFYGLIFGTGAPSTISRHTANRYLTNLRPLMYALRENPSNALHSSFTRLHDTASLKAALSRWRPGAGNALSRILPWAVSAPLNLSREEQPAVGDLGHYSISPDGEAVFIKLANLQEQLGGYELRRSTGKQIPDHSGVWRISANLAQFDPTRWRRRILAEIALDYLSARGKQLAAEHSVAVEALVLIVEVIQSHDVDYQPRSDMPHPYIFAHFDSNGRWLGSYFSESLLEGSVPDVSPQSAPSLEMWLDVRCVQIEDDELRINPDEQSPLSFALQASMGDVGYYWKDTDGRSSFHVVTNTSSDFTSVDIKALEGNECEHISSHMWRSPPINPKHVSSVCYSWTATSSIDLPDDLKVIYLHTCLTSDRTHSMEARTTCGMIDKVTYVVQASTPSECEPPCNLLLRLIVAFSKTGRPERVEWSTSDHPSRHQENILFPAPCKVLPYPQILVPVDCAELSLSPWYRPLEGAPRRPSQAKGQLIQKQCLGQRVLDFGYWRRDPEGLSADQWVHLRRGVHHSLRQEAAHSVSPGYRPCNKVSDILWQSEGFEDLTIPHMVLYVWIEKAPSASLAELQEIKAWIADQHPMSQDDLCIVTKVTTNVIVTTVPDNSLRFDPGMYSTPHVYVCLPPDGGCYAYWSSYEHSTVNSQALANLNLEKASLVPGCSTRVSVDIETTTLDVLWRRSSGLVSERFDCETSLCHEEPMNPSQGWSSFPIQSRSIPAESRFI